MNSSDQMPAADTGVHELLLLKPALRDDLEFTHDGVSAPPCYVIEDRVRSKFYRIGIPEYRFISLLDGKTSVEKALVETTSDLGEDALDVQDAAVIVNWLIQSELAHPQGGAQHGHLVEQSRRRSRQEILKRLNLMFVKIPLMNPDRLLERILPYFQWMLSPAFFIIWLLAMISGLYLVLAEWDRFARDASGILAVNNWLWLLLVWVVLKLLHEFFHGLMCKKHGGDVYEAGVIMILFAPIGYVDATTSWRFRSRWQRISTAAAGMYIEFFIAAVAVWIWSYSEPGMTRFMAYNIILIASVNALLFNANPLMKFDGYYIFSDLVRIPNLYGEGQAWMKNIARKWLLGLPVVFPSRAPREQGIITVYGVLSFIWRILILITLLFIAASLFHGAGLIVALLSASIVIGVPVSRFVKYLFKGNASEQPSLIRFAVTTGLLLTIGIVVFTQFGWSRSLSSPAIVDFSKLETVHAESSGFVSEVFVHSGQRVSKGEELIRLRNNELTAGLHDAELEVSRLKLQRREQIWENRIAEGQALQRKVEAAESLLNNLQRQVDHLLLRAPLDGLVVSHDLDMLQGRFVERGEELLQLTGNRDKEVRVLVAQEDARDYRAKLGSRVQVYIHGRGTQKKPGILQRIEPRATAVVRYPALSALGGGSLPVTTDTDSARSGNVFTEPYFEGIVILSAAHGLNAGETGEVSIKAQTVPLGQLWMNAINDWLDTLTRHEDA